MPRYDLQIETVPEKKCHIFAKFLMQSMIECSKSYFNNLVANTLHIKTLKSFQFI